MTAKRESKPKPKAEKQPKLVLPKETLKDLEPPEQDEVKGGKPQNNKDLI